MLKQQEHARVADRCLHCACLTAARFNTEQSRHYTRMNTLHSTHYTHMSAHTGLHSAQKMSPHTCCWRLASPWCRFAAASQHIKHTIHYACMNMLHTRACTYSGAMCTKKASAHLCYPPAPPSCVSCRCPSGRMQRCTRCIHQHMSARTMPLHHTPPTRWGV